MEGLIVLIFIVGYAAIVLEHKLSINKSASALLTGVLCWAVVALVSTNIEETLHHLNEHLSEIASILFFLMGAMTIGTFVAFNTLMTGFTQPMSELVSTSAALQGMIADIARLDDVEKYPEDIALEAEKRSLDGFDWFSAVRASLALKTFGFSVEFTEFFGWD